MKKVKKRIVSYDDMIAGYYGNVHHHRHHHRHHFKAQNNALKTGALVHSKSYDDGEILGQDTEPGLGEKYEEYVLGTSMSADYEEYIVGEDNSYAAASSIPTDIDIPAIPHINLPEEYKTNMFDPLGLRDKMQPGAISGFGDGNTGDDPFAVSASADIPVSEDIGESLKSTLSESDLIADMQSILNGDKVFDPYTKQTIPKGSAASMSVDEPPRERKQERPQQKQDEIQLPASNEHAIFDKIAQSMQYANAYDLGTYELENRFSDFDRISDYKEKETAQKANTAKKEEPQPILKAGHEEFIKDMDAIRSQQQDEGKLKQAMDAEERARMQDGGLPEPPSMHDQGRDIEVKLQDKQPMPQLKGDSAKSETTI